MKNAFLQIILVIIAGAGITGAALLIARFSARWIDSKRKTGSEEETSQNDSNSIDVADNNENQ
ncbi:MAG: hypothetical protein PHT04_04880 [Eubacteriales bacterium]|nr:hypothetical protein [Eubacteriales bacterium]